MLTGSFSRSPAPTAKLLSRLGRVIRRAVALARLPFDPAFRAGAHTSPTHRFRLLSYFSFSCAIAMAIITIAFAVAYRWHQSAAILSTYERNNVAMARQVSNVVWHRYASHLASLDAAGEDRTPKQPEYALLDGEIRAMTAGLDVVGLRILTPSGRTVYASDALLIGAGNSENKMLARVLATLAPSSAMVAVEEIAGSGGAQRATTAVESYVPIVGPGGQIAAVFALATDITPAVAHLRRDVAIATLACVICLVLLYALLNLIVSRADRTIAWQHDELKLALASATNAESEARAFADRLKDSNASIQTLNHELADSLDKLKDAHEELIRKGKLAHLGQLTATVAHEIRNPLGAVRNAAYIVGRKIDIKALGVDKQFERINNGIKRCDTIISELLDFARSKALSLKTLKLDEWLLATIEEEARTLPKEVVVRCELGLAGVEATFDADRMRRVIINLLSNASEAMTTKGPTGQVTASPRILVASRQVGDVAEIVVSDNGPGITPENIKKIREPLFTTKSFGVGLGIPAIEKILEQHGGGLGIASEVGHGATFTARFPLRQSAGAAKAA